MLRFFFWTFLIINGLLLALNFGALGNWSMEEREPLRLKAQKNVDKIKLISANETQDIIDAAQKKNQASLACIEFAGMTLVDGKSFEDKLKPLALGGRQTRSETTEVATNMVYLPSLGSKDAADKKALALRKLGITDFFVVQEPSPMKWSISLGVFKTPDAAKAHLANLVKKGLKEARIAPKPVSAAKLTYHMQDLTPEEKASIDKLKDSYPGIETRECKVSAAP